MFLATAHCLWGTPVTLAVEKKGLKTPPTEIHGNLRTLFLQALMINATFSTQDFKYHHGKWIPETLNR